jgi:hypothetical protein
MDIYNYWCVNKDCKEHEGYTQIKLTEEEKKEEHFCLECKGKLKLMGMISNVHAKIGSMTPNERKQALLKRSSIHNKKDSYLSSRRQELNEKAATL